LVDDSDLGEQLVTAQVGRLAPVMVDAALDRGQALASSLLEQGLIVSALLALQGQSRIVSQR
ncbi:MAG: UPF0280 family protein, partial [Quisquiliibacterium sp.]